MHTPVIKLYKSFIPLVAMLLSELSLCWLKVQSFCEQYPHYVLFPFDPPRHFFPSDAWLPAPGVTHIKEPGRGNLLLGEDTSSSPPPGQGCACFSSGTSWEVQGRPWRRWQRPRCRVFDDFLDPCSVISKRKQTLFSVGTTYFVYFHLHFADVLLQDVVLLVPDLSHEINKFLK